MTYNNTLSGLPVKAYDLNRAIGEINDQIRRPCIYTLFFNGKRPANTTSLYYGPFYIPLILKKAPTITYEIAAIGRTPEAAGQTFNSTTPSARYFWFTETVIAKSTESFSHLNTSTSSLFDSMQPDKALPITVGSTVIERPVVDPALFNEQNPTYSFDYGMFFFLWLRTPPPDVLLYDTYDSKDGPNINPQFISSFYAPSFVLNITTEYEI